MEQAAKDRNRFPELLLQLQGSIFLVFQLGIPAHVSGQARLRFVSGLPSARREVASVKQVPEWMQVRPYRASIISITRAVIMRMSSHHFPVI